MVVCDVAAVPHVLAVRFALLSPIASKCSRGEEGECVVVLAAAEWPLWQCCFLA